jgi:predicted phosphoribosyltransferase
MTQLPFNDRRQAGQSLGNYLASVPSGLGENSIVLGLARGGVPVAAEVAQKLQLPLDVLVVRKLGVPGHEELAMGAVAGGRVQVLDRTLITDLAISANEVEKTAANAIEEARRQEAYYRSDHEAPNLRRQTVILVDDGLATGSSMLAAVHYVNSFQPTRVIAAAPVGTGEAVSRLRRFADDCFCLTVPDEFGAVGRWYRNFDQVSDEEVRNLLEHHRLAWPHLVKPRTVIT